MQVFSTISGVLFPSHCLVCKQQGNYLCLSCKAKLLPHPEICPSCHKASPNALTCFSCKEQNKTVLSGVLIPFSYNQEIKKCLYAVKFYHRYDIAGFLAERLALHIQSHPILHEAPGNTVITRVPNHRTRRRFQKWYNQSKILATQTARLLDIPAIGLVSKIKKTASQVSLSRAERLQNLLWVFQTKDSPLDPSIKRVIIIDDITTTGSSLEQVAKTIKTTHPNLEIWWCVVARHN